MKKVFATVLSVIGVTIAIMAQAPGQPLAQAFLDDVYAVGGVPR